MALAGMIENDGRKRPIARTMKRCCNCRLERQFCFQLLTVMVIIFKSKSVIRRSRGLSTLDGLIVRIARDATIKKTSVNCHARVTSPHVVHLLLMALMASCLTSV